MIAFLKRGRMILAILIIVLALLSSLVRALTPWVAQYKADFEKHLSTLLGRVVVIEGMQTGWYWFEPVIKLNDVLLVDAKTPLLKLDRLWLGLDLWRSLWHWKIEPGVIYLQGVHVTARQHNGYWTFDGAAGPLSDRQASASTSIAWILTRPRIILKDVSLDLVLQDKTLIALPHISLRMANANGATRIKGEASLNQSGESTVTWMANLTWDGLQPERLQGQVYLAGQNVWLVPWQRAFTSLPLTLKTGLLDAQVWLDLKKGVVDSARAEIGLRHATGNDLVTHSPLDIASMDASLAWKKNADGWEATGDKIEGQINGSTWPENAFLVRYEASKEAWAVFVKSLVVESLLSLNGIWPEKWSALRAAKPQGLLQNTQIHSTQGKLDSVLTQVVAGGWSAVENIPGVSNISGVFSWKPLEGRFDIDTNNFTLTSKGLPAIHPLTCNATLDWQITPAGLRVHARRFILTHPDFVIKVQGILDSLSLTPSEKTTGNLHLTAALSANNAQQWLPWLPKTWLKPRLNTWLKKDITRVEHLVANAKISGSLADFPFDAEAGIFQINADVKGVDLVFAKHWPKVNALDGSLQINQRLLTGQVMQADLLDTPVSALTLHIADLGLDKETLHVYGTVQADASRFQAFIRHSPLDKKVAVLKKMQIKGPLDLQLKLAVPLYPENDTVLAEGKVRFHDNDMVLNLLPKPLAVNGLEGLLLFNEKGIAESHIKALVFNNPMSIGLSSIHDKNPRTELALQGRASIAALKKIVPWSFLSRMHGAFTFESLVQLLSAPHQKNTVLIKTSLEGLAMDLPLSIGKKAAERVPLTVELGFREGTWVDLAMQYRDWQVKTEKQKEDQWSIHIEQPAVQGSLVYDRLKNSLSGSFYTLHIPKMVGPEQPLSSALIKDTPNMNLRIDSLQYGDWVLGRFTGRGVLREGVYVLEDGTLDSPAYHMAITGEWAQKGRVNKTTMTIAMQIHHLKAMLEQWKIPPVVNSHKGEIQWQGHWPGGYHDFSLKKAQGSLNIVLKDGLITHFSPEMEEKLGLGKLLSILSLQTIPRRLKLDFSDLSHRGYSFDVFRGQFTLNDGILTTHDSTIDGPVAYASMKGSLDMLKKQYAMRLTISPHVTASLPVVATIAGGPIAGVAVWAASKLINQGMKQISGYTYRITGSFKHPSVESVSVFNKGELNP